jgi:hypothetical protein
LPVVPAKIGEENISNNNKTAVKRIKIPENLFISLSS